MLAADGGSVAGSNEATRVVEPAENPQRTGRTELPMGTRQQVRANPEAPGRVCDFCGDRVQAVRRVALDREYDRLQKAHRELYSCASCFEKKEKQRLGLVHR